MNWNLRKMTTALAVSCAAFTNFMHAAEDTQLRNLENRVSSLEQRRGSNCVINPPARCFSCDRADVFIDASVFVWQATESGMEYAQKTLGNTDNTASSNSFKKPQFDWDWGFKLGAGYNTPHDGWDLFLQWTRFHPSRTHRFSSVPAIAGNAVVPLLSPNTQLSGDETTTASASWKFRLDMLDLELGREFYTSRWLTLRPFAGLRSAWIHQRTKVDYDSVTTAVVTPINVDVNLKNNYWGMGLRAGLDSEWGLGRGISLYTEMSGSLLLGHFNIFESQSGFDTVGVVPGTTSFSEKFRATRFVYDLGMAIRYQQFFCCERYEFMAQLGWEQHMFVNQNQIQKTYTSTTGLPSTIFVTNQGDLSTQGVTLTLEFGF